MKIFKHLNGYDIETPSGILLIDTIGLPVAYYEGSKVWSAGIEISINDMPKSIAANILKFVYWRIN